MVKTRVTEENWIKSRKPWNREEEKEEEEEKEKKVRLGTLAADWQGSRSVRMTSCQRPIVSCSWSHPPVWSLLLVDQSPSAYWIVNPDNDVYGNVAAGSSHYGFW